ncbi:glycoside hydrolase family 127 protein [Lewinella sp. IMCC34183]|uniref:glycoside hydrolase family 127 protein n=1 Tax=Lewinella sp. IMCC34183 TaxID=2248762 RepID=UPI000E24D839|nr:glycoside hydrolase family 127 protein [Lewinella sp. IMCC34183]
MKIIASLLLSVSFLPVLTGQSTGPDLFPLSAVRLAESPFLNAEERDYDYLMALDPDRLLAPYLEGAGLPPDQPKYGNWESGGLGGHIGGHYISALSMLYAATGSDSVRMRLDYMLDGIQRAQEAGGDGYVGGVPDAREVWRELAAGQIEAQRFSLNDRWVPIYNLHKLFAGLRDAWTYAGSARARDMLLALGSWAHDLLSPLSDEQLQEILYAEPGGMNESFADLAEISGDDKYLELARRFSDRELLDPLLEHEDRLTGMHANTQIPKVIGFERIAELSGDTAWHAAARYFWTEVVENRTVAIGGNSVREHFHPADNFSPMIEDVQGPETCNTYNMLRLSKQLYETEGGERYLTYYERALYNHILSSEHPDRGGFVYFTPMRPEHYRVYSAPQTSMWCCVGSGLENHTKYGEMIYAHYGSDTLLVNLYIPSTLDWRERGVQVAQTNTFPDEARTELRIDGEEPARFTLLLRRPDWLTDGLPDLLVNGEAVQADTSHAGYLSLTRTWSPGDRVVLSLPMRTRLEGLPDGSAYYAVVHGPLVMAAKTGTEDIEGLVADDSRMGHVASGPTRPLADAPVLLGDPATVVDAFRVSDTGPLQLTAPDVLYPATASDLTLIPFYRLHDARYMIYWRVTTPEDLAEWQAFQEEQAAKSQQLEERTVDRVIPGEQQPEVEHDYTGEKDRSGIREGRLYRNTRDYFAYTLSDPEGVGRRLQLTFFGGERDRSFDLVVNGKKVATVDLQDDLAPVFYTREYELPAAVTDRAVADGITVRFEAAPGSTTASIFDVRLLR